MNKPLVILDSYVLAQNVRTGIFRVCDELFTRLAASRELEVEFFNRPNTDEAVRSYMDQRPVAVPRFTGSIAESGPCVFLSPFGVAPPEWLAASGVLHAHIIYDLIGINHPEFFHANAAAEVTAIMSSLDEDTLIFAISEATKNDLLKHRPDLSNRQIIVIPLAASPSFKPNHDLSCDLKMRIRYGIPVDVPYVLSVATLEVRKNLQNVIVSFVRYLERNPENSLHLILSGMLGWHREKIDEALENAGRWRDRIVVTGFIEDEDLAPLYSGALCFVYLSRYEGFGLPVLEAMACGTPVICSNNSSLPEVVCDSGILVDPDDIEGVATAINLLVNSTEFRKKLSISGLSRAQTFSWERCAEVVESALQTAYTAHLARPSLRRLRPQMPGTIVDQLRQSDGRLRANFQYYQNGSEGPSFGSSKTTGSSFKNWPVWCDRLPLTPGLQRSEGGLRLTKGAVKRNTPHAPLVSYVTVVRNNAIGLVRAIESVQQQTYENVEHVILDGASTDGTLKVIEERANEVDYYVSEPDEGLYHAMNKAIPLARGQLICVLNSDDWLEPNAAQIAVQRMREGASMLLSAAIVPDASTEWYPSFVHPGCYFKLANVCHNAIYATPDAYRASGPYDTDYRIAADFKWIMTCLDADVRFVYTRERTINYSLGGVSSDVNAHRAECIRISHERFPKLTEDELEGLHNLFFVFGERAPRFASGAERTQFLRDVFAAHGDQPDLIKALSWAAVERTEFPREAQPSGWKYVRRKWKAKIKSFLKKS